MAKVVRVPEADVTLASDGSVELTYAQVRALWEQVQKSYVPSPGDHFKTGLSAGAQSYIALSAAASAILQDHYRLEPNNVWAVNFNGVVYSFNPDAFEFFKIQKGGD